jgi:hypothetical protein
MTRKPFGPVVLTTPLLLHRAAERGDNSELESLLAGGCEVAAMDEGRATALHWAAYSGQLAATRTLIAHGAPVHLRDKTYQALPLDWADHGSIQRRHPQADYMAVALTLFLAGSPMYPDLSAYGDDVVAALAEFRRRCE